MPAIERSINRGTSPSAGASIPADMPLDAAPKNAGEPDEWWRDLPPQPAPALFDRQSEPAFELDRVGMRVNGDGSDGSELLSWKGRGGEVSNVVGGSEEDRRRLLAVIAGRLPASVGRCRIAGHELEALPQAAQRALRHRVVGSVLRGDALFPHLSLRENVALPLLASAVPDTLALKQAQIELERLGLGDVGDAQPENLGASQCRLALVAIALTHPPRLCVIASPEESLRDRQIAMLRQRLWQAAHVDGVCLVMSTAHPQLASLVGTTLSLPKSHTLPVRT